MQCGHRCAVYSAFQKNDRNCIMHPRGGALPHTESPFFISFGSFWHYVKCSSNRLVDWDMTILGSNVGTNVSDNRAAKPSPGLFFGILVVACVWQIILSSQNASVHVFFSKKHFHYGAILWYRWNGWRRRRQRRRANWFLPSSTTHGGMRVYITI